MPHKKLSRNAPCPCGSGKKFKHCCYSRGVEDDLGLGSGRQQPQYPIGTVAMYGPDDKTTTKMAAGVILHENAEPIMMRWVATDIATNPKVQRELKAFLPPARRQAGGHEPGEHGLPARGGRGLSAQRGLPVLPVLEGEAGEQPAGLTHGPPGSRHADLLPVQGSAHYGLAADRNERSRHKPLPMPF